MKTKIATALSIVAVLGAGSAAALVNTQILDSGPSASGASKAVLPPASSIELTVPDVAADPARAPAVSTVAPTTSTSPAVTSTTVVAPSPASSGMLTAFNVGDAGVVTVDVVNGQLVLVSAEPAPGWTVTKAEDDSNDDSDDDQNEVEVEFVSSNVRVEFEAMLIDGRIVPKVESTSIGSTAAASDPSSPSTTSDTIADDDEYDDEYDDDEYDDDRDDDRDDD
jgi:hypothetical protein